MQIELVQAFLPNRSFSLLDIVADMIGAGFGVIVVEILKRIYYWQKQSQFFECQACGNQQAKWLGKCPQCGAWDSFVELSQQEIKISKEIAKSSGTPSKAISIDEVEIQNFTRFSTKDSELDLVLGGGVVEGSLVLIGGSPGIGKSTLLLKIGSNLAKDG